MKRIAFSPAELNLVRMHDVCRIATVSRGGWPHCVPVGYLYKNGQFYIPASKKSKKVRNLRADSRACVVIDDEQESVLMIQGRVRIVEGREFLELKRWMTAKTGWTLGKESDGAILVLKPSKKAKWKPLV
jgi:nitroimidazol reductase NimA-like FMN-containing flavoprotein (pyridoxamine 5'-phosphate oxidase superfamily)